MNVATSTSDVSSTDNSNTRKQYKNKIVACRPFYQSKETQCHPIVKHVSTQICKKIKLIISRNKINEVLLRFSIYLALDDIQPSHTVVPVPVPINVPLPMCMFQAPMPVPIIIPIPIPVPVFIPTTKKTYERVQRRINVTKKGNLDFFKHFNKCFRNYDANYHPIQLSFNYFCMLRNWHEKKVFRGLTSLQTAIRTTNKMIKRKNM